MDLKKTTYIRFNFPGLPSTESRTVEVESRALSAVEVPTGAESFTFYDIITTVVDVDGVDVTLSSDELNTSPTYYWGGTVMTEEDVTPQITGHKHIVANMRVNGWIHIIQTSCGRYLPFYPDRDVLLKP